MKGTVPAQADGLYTGCTQIKNNILLHCTPQEASVSEDCNSVRVSNVLRCEHILFAKNAKKVRKLLDTLSTAYIISVSHYRRILSFFKYGGRVFRGESPAAHVRFCFNAFFHTQDFDSHSERQTHSVCRGRILPGRTWEYSQTPLSRRGRRGSSPEAEYIRNGGVSA